MANSVLLIVGTQVVFYAIMAYFIIQMRQRLRDRGTRTPLQEALLERDAIADHRIDAATQEAAEGFRPCLVCGFANSKRSRFCVICDDKLAVTPSELARQHEKRLTARQQRAQRRREWTRKQDVQGNVFWYRDGKHAGRSGDSLFTGFVVQFTPLAQHDAYTETMGNEGLLANDGVQQIPNISIRLREEANAHSLQSVVAAVANPLVFPNGSTTVDTTENVKEMLEMAAKDFPTKFTYFVVTTASLVVPTEVGFLKLSVHRDYVVGESIEHLSCIDQKHIRSGMRINFLDETGVDAGGLHREWLTLLNERILDSSIGIFTCTNHTEQSYYINANSVNDNGEDHLMYFFAVGRLIGRALLEGEVLDFHLSLPLIKIILGQPVTLNDLEYFDPEIYRSLLWLLENDGVESLGLDFSVVARTDACDKLEVVDLIPNGRNIIVTDSNKQQFVTRKMQYLLFESVSNQLFAFLKGIYDVLPLHLLLLFDADEFDYVLCGSDTIDVVDWERHTKCSKNLQHSRVLRWFWELVRDMPNEYRRRLLQFATGCARVPIVGFKGLTSYDGHVCPFTLKGVKYDETCPFIRSHACFNRLDVPLYPTRQELKKVLYATLETDMYGFTTI